MRVEPRRLLLLSLSSLLISVTAILLTTPPASSHEISIYRGYPLMFWLLITLIPTTSVAYLLLSEGVSRKDLLVISLTVFVTYIILFTIPTFRGYFLYGRGAADVLSHLGQVKTIAVTSHLPEDDFYPVIHIIIFVFTAFGVPVNFTPSLIAAILFILYSTGMFVYIRILTKSRRISILAFSCSMPLVFLENYLVLQPFLLSFLLIPFVLYLFEASRLSWGWWRYSALLIVVLFMVAFAHPETTILLLMIFLASVTARHLYVWRYNANVQQYNLLVIPILAILFFTWYFSFRKLQLYGSRLIASVFLGVESSTPSPRGSSITNAALELTDLFFIIIRFIEIFGSTAIFSGLAAFMVGMILWRILYKRSITFFECYAAVNFTTAATVAAVLLFGVPVFGNAFMRAARYPLLFAVPLVALLVFEFIDRQRFEFTSEHRKTLAIGCIILILATVPLTINGLFIDNYHHTNTEFEGTEFFLEHYNEEHATKSVRMTSKIEAYIYGAHNERRGELPFRRFSSQGPEMPKHIGYDNHTTAGQTFDSGTYLITKDHDLEFYKTRPRDEWNESMVYTEKDLEKLSNDRCVDQIYSNDGFDVWIVC